MLHVSVLQYKDFNDCIRGYAGIRLVSIPNTPQRYCRTYHKGLACTLLLVVISMILIDYTYNTITYDSH